MILQKGLGYNAEYTSDDYPELVAGWVGTTSFYTTYPGIPVFSKALTLASPSMLLNLTIAEILNLDNTVYSVVTVISNPTLGVEVGVLEYATVLPINVSASTKCKIFGTIIKSDGTPAGKAGKALNNAGNGAIMVSTWIGVQVRVTHTEIDADSGLVVGTETIETTTNAAGYFEIYALQGLNVTLTCPSLPAVIPINTTGLSEYDIFDSI